MYTTQANLQKPIHCIISIKRLTLNDKTLLVKSDYVKPIKDLYANITKSASTTKAQLKQLRYYQILQ